MELIVATAVIAALCWVVVRWRRSPRAASNAAATAVPLSSAPAPAAVAQALQGLDLRALPSKRQRVRGTFAYVPARLRSTAGGVNYSLVREPANRHDANAIVVLFESKKVGYVSAATAASYAPLFDALGAGPFIVGGAAATQGSIKLFIDLPRVPELRAFVRSR